MLKKKIKCAYVQIETVKICNKYRWQELSEDTIKNAISRIKTIEKNIDILGDIFLSVSQKASTFA